MAERQSHRGHQARATEAETEPEAPKARAPKRAEAAPMPHDGPLTQEHVDRMEELERQKLEASAAAVEPHSNEDFEVGGEESMTIESGVPVAAAVAQLHGEREVGSRTDVADRETGTSVDE